MVGQTLSHYRIDAKLGEGGMGVVYRARDTHLDRPVAIKVLRPDAVANPERKRRFVQEAKAASALNHPNIVTIYDIDQSGGTDFIAMEYVPGKTLDQLIGRKGLPLGEALKYAVQIADALAKAHSAGIVHRDLKPANIMVTGEGGVKLLDFGLAKLTERSEADELAPTETLKPHTEEGTIVGTVAYMSPEQAEGKKVDARSDIFSFGSVLYEMVTGRRAFRGASKVSVLSAILHQEPQPVNEIAGEAPRDLEKIIARCLRKDPNWRFQHMDDLRIALHELKEESESGRLSPGVVSVKKPARRYGLKLAVAAGLVLAAAAAMLWWVRRSSTVSQGPVLTRLTSDSGLTMEPDVSPDGKLVAYVSDRSGDGNFDLWVQQVGGGEPLRLTRSPGDERYPRFSPDGTRIAYYVQRSTGQGIYTISTLGGEPQRIADRGCCPRFSPDGQFIAYLSEVQPGFVGPILGRSIAVVPASGGEPREIATGFYMVSAPLWSPDSKHLLMLGMSLASEAGWKNDWYLLPISGGKPKPVEVESAMRSAGINLAPRLLPAFWHKERVLFSTPTGDSVNLWQVSLSPSSFQVVGTPRRLTFGTESSEEDPSVGGNGLVAFASYTSDAHLYTLPLENRNGKQVGRLERLTARPGWYRGLSVSRDGRKLLYVYRSLSLAKPAVTLRDLVSAKETTLSFLEREDIPFESPPLLSPDGTRIAYQRRVKKGGREEGNEIVIRALDGGPAERLCENCGKPRVWFPDGKRLSTYYFASSGTRDSEQFGARFLDLASKEVKTLEAPPGHGVGVLALSPDGGWGAVALAKFPITSPPKYEIFLAPLRRDNLAPPAEWVPIPESSTFSWLQWPPDGNTLYFFNETPDGYSIEAQPLDSATQRPRGTRQTVYRFDRPSFFPYQYAGLAVTRERVILCASESKGNIWLMKLPEAN